MIRLATIGTSSIADKFLAACALTGRYTLTAVYSRDDSTGRAFADRHGCIRVYTSLGELADDTDVDAVYIASPNVFHASQSRIMLNAGKHVICEKPLVTSLTEYDELYNLATMRNRVFMEAIIPRFAASREAILQAMMQLGKISHVRIDYTQRSSRYDAFMRGEHQNIFDMTLHAGALMDLGIYCVYGAVDLFGVPRSINAAADYLHNGADYGGSVLFDYGDYHAQLSYSKIGFSSSGTEIIGDSGVLRIGRISQYADATLITAAGEKTIAPLGNGIAIMSGEAYRFADYIEHDIDFAADYTDFHSLCRNVHGCMDLIKKTAGIIYR